jgi:alpha-tubulin suppressor-like RCC1 family protein
MGSRARFATIFAAVAAVLALAAPALAQTSVAGWGYDAAGELGGGFSGKAELSPVPVLAGQPVVQLAASGGWSAALLEGGIVETWGTDRAGQLGNGSTTPSTTPEAVLGLTAPVTQIAIAGQHAIALLADGTVETWGQNGYGTLGLGTTGHGSETCCFSPVAAAVPGLHEVVQVAAGGADDAVLLRNGHVYAWGENHSGQLGDGTTTEKDSPTLVAGLEGVHAIALGGLASVGSHMLALIGDGTVRAIGENSAGQLGDGATSDSSSPVTVAGLSGVTQLAAAASHNLALLSGGGVRAWGQDKYGELGAGATGRCGRTLVPCATAPVTVPLSGASAVSAGLGYSLAVAGGNVYAWGKNRYGTLGDGTEIVHTSPERIGTLSGATQVVAGEQHAFAFLAAAAAGAAGAAVLPIELLSGHGALTVDWSSSDRSDPWRVAYRPAGKGAKAVPFSRKVVLAPGERTYTFTGLATQQYEVLVEGKVFGRRIVTGTPLAG